MPNLKVNNKNRLIHPYSRKAKKVEQRVLHKQKLHHGRHIRSTKLDILAERLVWFHDHLDDRKVYTECDVFDMLRHFQNRFDNELEQISIIHSVGGRKRGNQHASREAAIRFTLETEKNEFESVGIELPDLTSSSGLETFIGWNREMKYVQNLKLRRININYLENSCRT